LNRALDRRRRALEGASIVLTSPTARLHARRGHARRASATRTCRFSAVAWPPGRSGPAPREGLAALMLTPPTDVVPAGPDRTSPHAESSVEGARAEVRAGAARLQARSGLVGTVRLTSSPTTVSRPRRVVAVRPRSRSTTLLLSGRRRPAGRAEARDGETLEIVSAAADADEDRLASATSRCRGAHRPAATLA
jgi:hypothetical protein